ncbi:MAG: S-layer homology domain-containing protein, partial [Bacillota bacterium]|nr:S-layer homology domain-containing protein [Bacillota bacterium]
MAGSKQLKKYKQPNFINVWLIAIILLISLMGQASAFEDVNQHWAEPEIRNLASRHIIKGYSDSKFAPDQTVTRGELAALIVGALGLEEQAEIMTKANPSFSDVPATHWAKGYIEIAREYGLVYGYQDNRFGLNQGITREELVTILMRTIPSLQERLDQQPFSTSSLASIFIDGDTISGWASDSLRLAYQLQLIKGYEDKTIRPRAEVTRAQAAVMIKRLLAIKGEEYQFFGFVNGGDPNLSRLDMLVNGQEARFSVARDVIYYYNGTKAHWRDLDIFSAIFFNINENGEISYIAQTNKYYKEQPINIVVSNTAKGQQAAFGASNSLGEVRGFQHIEELTASNLILTPTLTGIETGALQLKQQLAVSGKAVKVAIVDSGIDAGHPDFVHTSTGKAKISEVIDVTDEGLVQASGQLV